MSTPLSFCDINARFGQEPAPQQTIEEQTGWNPKQFFLDLLQKIQDRKEQSAKEAEEDALMAMIDAMNASEEDKASGRTEQTLTESLANAGKAINERYNGKVAPEDTLTVQALLACLGDRFTFEQADEIQENQDKSQEDREQETEKERLEVTEACDPSETGEPDQLRKEV